MSLSFLSFPRNPVNFIDFISSSLCGQSSTRGLSDQAIKKKKMEARSAIILRSQSQNLLAITIMVAAIILLNTSECSASGTVSLNSNDTVIGNMDLDTEFLLDSEMARRVLINFQGVTPPYTQQGVPADCNRNGKYIGSCIGPENGKKNGEKSSVFKRP